MEPASQPPAVMLIGLSHRVVRPLLRCLQEDGGPLVGWVAADLESALASLGSARPCLAVIDWCALGGPLADAARRLRAARPGLRIACTGHDEEPYRAAAWSADAYVPRERLYEELPGLAARAGAAPPDATETGAA